MVFAGEMMRRAANNARGLRGNAVPLALCWAASNGVVLALLRLPAGVRRLDVAACALVLLALLLLWVAELTLGLRRPGGRGP